MLPLAVRTTLAVGILLGSIVWPSGAFAEPSADNTENRIDVQIGTQRALPLPPAQDQAQAKIDVADPSIVSCRVETGRLIITALKKGVTSVRVLQGETSSIDYVVTTWNIPPGNIIEMIKSIPGVQQMRTGAKITFMGALLSQQDLDRLQKISDAYSDDLTNLAFYNSQESKEMTLEYILKAIGNPSVKAHFTEDNLVLEGIVFSLEDKERAGTAASAYVGEKGRVFNSITVVDLPVNIEVWFILFTPTSSSQIGADADTLGRVSGPSMTFSLKKTSDMAAGTLNVGTMGYEMAGTYLKSNGIIKTITKPYIQTISGKKGSVLYGGEIGVKTTSTQGAGSVDYKKYGLILSVTPVVRPDNTVTLDVTLEVSQPTNDSSKGADIQFQTFRTETSGSVKIGDTLVLAGVKEVVRSKFSSKVPVMGDIPLLNLLFAREDKSDRQTDIVVLLTPHVPRIESDPRFRKSQAEQAVPLTDKVEDPDMTFKKVK